MRKLTTRIILFHPKKKVTQNKATSSDVDSLRNLFNFRDAFTLLPKYHGIGQKIIEQAGNDQSCKITINHVPSENLLEQQQEQHLDQEAHSRREIENHEAVTEITRAALSYTALPYPAIRPKEIAQHCKFKRDDGREHVNRPIRAEYEIRAYPQNQGIYPCPEQTCYQELEISLKQGCSFHSFSAG